MPSASHRPRKRFGQHFLHDRRILERIVETIDPQRRDAIVEIGPGEGALTRLLLDKVPRLEAIEIDRDLAARLQEQFPPERLTVHCADALRFDFSACPAGARLVGNLPYNISTPLLFHLAGYADRVRDMHFMLQLEVVERMVAEPSTPAYGRLSVMLQYRFHMEKLLDVPPGSFRPAPKVNSAIVRMIPMRPEEIVVRDEATFARMVDKTPEGFTFAVKVPRAMTHELTSFDRELEPFQEAVAPLAEAGRLGALLFFFMTGPQDNLDRFRLREFVTTETELNAMAAPAMTGFKRYSESRVTRSSSMCSFSIASKSSSVTKITAGSASTSPSVAGRTPAGSGCAGFRDQALTSTCRASVAAQKLPNLPRPYTPTRIPGW